MLKEKHELPSITHEFYHEFFFLFASALALFLASLYAKFFSNFLFSFRSRAFFYYLTPHSSYGRHGWETPYMDVSTMLHRHSCRGIV